MENDRTHEVKILAGYQIPKIEVGAERLLPRDQRRDLHAANQRQRLIEHAELDRVL